MLIEEIIEKNRKKGVKDDLVVKEILKSYPEKKEVFQIALNRGANSTQIIDEIIKQNKILKEKKGKDNLIKELIAKIEFKIKRPSFLTRFLNIIQPLPIGIDISDHSIEIIRLNNRMEIISHGRAILDDGIINNGKILNQKKLIDILNKMLGETKPFPIIYGENKKEIEGIVSIPDSQAYIEHFTFENNDDLYEKVKEEVEKNIPLSIKKIYWDFLEIKDKKEKVSVICVAVERNIIEDYIYFLRSAGIIPLVFDVESISIVRSVLYNHHLFSKKIKNKKQEKVKNTKNTIILDIGARVTLITVYDFNGIMRFATSIPYAGSFLTNKIAEHLGISIEEAEKIKIEKGFQKDTEIVSVLEKEALKIINETKQAISFYESDSKKNIDEIIIVGGSALLPNIVNFFQKFFEAKIEIGNPFSKVKKSRYLKEGEEVLYSNVVGLALRGVFGSFSKNEFNLLPNEIKTKENQNQIKKRRVILIVSIIIAFLGLMIFSFTVYYFIHYPKPFPMEDLRYRGFMFYPEQEIEDDEIEIEIKIKEEFKEETINVFKESSDISDIIFTVTYYDDLKLLQKSDSWYKITTNNKEGWIRDNYVEMPEELTLE